jgi:signal transduction histidine kinase
MLDTRRRQWFRPGKMIIRTFCISEHEVRPDFRNLEIPAGFFEDQAVISVPIQHPTQLGRLWLTSRRHAFRVSDVEFIHQVIGSVTSVVDNIRLVDKLATSAADEERRRLARDLHDGVIQPYIGIQIGLTAARNQLERACPESKEIPAGVRERLAVLGKGLDELLEMTESGIRELREIVYNLRGGGALNGHLVEAVQRFASRFADATGIGTCVEVDGDIRVSDRVAGELFRMVEEGLSNIRRHTESPVARIKLSRSNGSLILKIENDIKNSAGFRTFIPNSIAERAAALQGTSRVECEKGSCAVIVTIPIPVQQMVAV